MYRNILLAYNGSQAGQQALLASKELATWGQASLHLIAVMPFNLSGVVAEGIVYSAEEEKLQRESYQTVLNQGLALLHAEGYRASGELLSGDPVNEICECARRIQADLIVVGHKHRASWVQRWWSGSVSQSLIEESPCSVFVCIR